MVKKKPKTKAQKPANEKPTKYIVTDGELTLELELDEEVGGYSVTSPFNPDIITQGETLEEVFAMARDCAALMKTARKQMTQRKQEPSPRRGER